MSERLLVCLLCGVAIATSGCKKSEGNATPAAGTASVMTTGGNSASTANPVTAAGTGTSGTAGVAGMNLPTAVAGMDASTGQAGTNAAGADAPATAGKDGSAGAGAGGAGAGGAMAGAGAGGAAGSAGTGGVGGTAGAGGASDRPIAKFPIRNLLAGACELTQAVPDPSTCMGWDEVYECVAADCELAECEELCADHVKCAGAAPDPCDVETACPRSDACDKCQYSVKACAIAQGCELMFRCAMPSADGACSRLNTCCLKQNDPLECSAWHDRISLTQGDAGCDVFINDPGFLRAYVNDPPCVP